MLGATLDLALDVVPAGHHDGFELPHGSTRNEEVSPLAALAAPDEYGPQVVGAGAAVGDDGGV